MANNVIVITTIQKPTSSLLSLASHVSPDDFTLLIVGDRKTPNTSWPRHSVYLSLARQFGSGYSLATRLPENHYSRKNIGYLEACARGARAIFDTDDDNAPLPFWKIRCERVFARNYTAQGWVNIYKWFSNELIWPRGLPLDCIHNELVSSKFGPLSDFIAPIQQGLANGSPDVDAIWRLIFNHPIDFNCTESVYLQPGAWCPFNSQSTWWFPRAYPLLYLPSYCSFRMTDIWRSLIAQRCLWALDMGVAFHGPEMHQNRNKHDIIIDMGQEIPGYLGNKRIAQILNALPLEAVSNCVEDNLRACYIALVAADIFPTEELELLDYWLRDLQFALN